MTKIDQAPCNTDSFTLTYRDGWMGRTDRTKNDPTGKGTRIERNSVNRLR